MPTLNHHNHHQPTTTTTTTTVSVGCGSRCRRLNISNIFNPKPYKHKHKRHHHHRTSSSSSSSSSSNTTPTTTTTTTTAATLSPTGSDTSTPVRIQGFGWLGGNSLAVEKDSSDPYVDFRDSMLQMIVEKEIHRKDDLRQLLDCFLQLNSPYYHAIIIGAFTEIWNNIASSNA